MAIAGVGLLDPVEQWTDANGVPLAGGSVAFYVPQTLTLLAVYSDPALSVPLPNPVPLNGSGRTSTSSIGLATPVYLQQTAYDYLVRDQTGTIQVGPITTSGSAWPGQVQGQAVVTPVANANATANSFTTTINKAASGTHSLFVGTRFTAPQIGPGASVLTESDTVLIDGPPTAGATVYALKVAAGNTSLGGPLTVAGDATITGNTNVSGNLNVGGTATITGATLGGTFTGRLNTSPVIPSPGVGVNALGHIVGETVTTAATGSHGVLAGLYMPAPVIAAGGATVGTAATLYIGPAPTIGTVNYGLVVGSNATVTGTLSTSSMLTASNGLTVNNGLTVSGVTNLTNALTVTGGTSLTTLTASGTAVFNAPVTVNSNLGVTGTLTVTSGVSLGPTTLASVTVTGASQLNGVVTAPAGANISGINCVGFMTITQNLGITGTLTVTGASQLNGGANISGINCVGFMTITQDLGITGALTVTGATQLNSTLTVLGTSVLNAVGANSLTVNNGIVATKAWPWANIPVGNVSVTANSTGSVTLVTTGHPWVFRYVIIGKTLHVQVGARVNINNGTTNEIRFNMPGNTFMPWDPLSGADEDQSGTAGVFNDTAGNTGVMAILINVAGSFVSCQRADGILGNGYVSGSSVNLRFTIEIPLA